MFFLKKNIFSKEKYFFLPFFNATFQCGRYGVFKKNLKFFFGPEKVKKRTSKVAHNQPRPLYFTVQPRPTASSPELILHIKKSWDQTSVLLSVIFTLTYLKKPNFINSKSILKWRKSIFPHKWWKAIFSQVGWGKGCGVSRQTYFQ